MLTRLKLHVSQLVQESLAVLLGDALQRGYTLIDGNACAWVCTISDAGLDVLGLEGDLLVEDSIGVTLQLFPALYSTVPLLTLGSIFTTLQVFEGGFVGSNDASARAHLNGEIGERETTLHAQRSDGATCIFHGIACGTACGHLSHDIEGNVLGCDARLQYTFHVDAHGLGLLLQDTLRGQHLGHLAGADTHGYGAHSSMRAGV